MIVLSWNYRGAWEPTRSQRSLSPSEGKSSQYFFSNGDKTDR